MLRLILLQTNSRIDDMPTSVRPANPNELICWTNCNNWQIHPLLTRPFHQPRASVACSSRSYCTDCTGGVALPAIANYGIAIAESLTCRGVLHSTIDSLLYPATPLRIQLTAGIQMNLRQQAHSSSDSGSLSPPPPSCAIPANGAVSAASSGARSPSFR